MLVIQLILIGNISLFAQNQNTYLSFENKEGDFAISSENEITPIVIDEQDYEGVEIVSEWLVNDIQKVTGKRTQIYQKELPQTKNVILIGTLGKNKWIDQLINDKKLNIKDIQGQWEMSCLQVVENPFPNVDKALVLIGSDKRGTIYSMLNLSREMGVSPWYWWADVPVDKHESVFVKRGRYITQSPKVKYRGIFLNDEEPALGGWVRENFGGFNAKFYNHVFELILRLKGNFLWPAMWGKAFFDDDPENGKLADKLGIVMSTSHHEPMGRAQAEWHRYGSGAWNYKKNEEVLSDFWQKGMERNKDYETVVTVGMPW